MTSAKASMRRDPLLDAWDRHCEIVLNLLRAVPAGGLGARPLDGSPTVAAMFSHMHHERVASVRENAPECGGDRPPAEWNDDGDADSLAAQLGESGVQVREAVARRLSDGRALDQDFSHPSHLIHFLIFHESYHHGQIKLALKAAGLPLADQVVGPLTWGVWRRR